MFTIHSIKFKQSKQTTAIYFNIILLSHAKKLFTGALCKITSHKSSLKQPKRKCPFTTHSEKNNQKLGKESADAVGKMIRIPTYN